MNIRDMSKEIYNGVLNLTLWVSIPVAMIFWLVFLTAGFVGFSIFLLFYYPISKLQKKGENQCQQTEKVTS